jgi:hypothetical protein
MRSKKRKKFILYNSNRIFKLCKFIACLNFRIYECMSSFFIQLMTQFLTFFLQIKLTLLCIF